MTGYAPIHSEARPAAVSWSRNSTPSVSGVAERSLCSRIWAVVKAFSTSPLVNAGPSAIPSFVAVIATKWGRFEFTALKRLVCGSNYNVIPVDRAQSGLILGALPNKLSDDGARLVNREGIKAVLSINEPWERRQVGTLSVPYTQEEWGRLGVVGYGELDVRDHTFLTPDQLNSAADFIHRQIAAGRTVYIHCRAGQGRSSAAIAAYLIKHKQMRKEAACELIAKARPKATIWDKIDSLQAFQEYLDRQQMAVFEAVFNVYRDLNSSAADSH